MKKLHTGCKYKVRVAFPAAQVSASIVISANTIVTLIGQSYNMVTLQIDEQNTARANKSTFAYRARKIKTSKPNIVDTVNSILTGHKAYDQYKLKKVMKLDSIGSTQQKELNKAIIYYQKAISNAVIKPAPQEAAIENYQQAMKPGALLTWAKNTGLITQEPPKPPRKFNRLDIIE